MKIIKPISDPDDIRDQAAEATKEQYADFYVNQPAPDPLTWQPPTKKEDKKDQASKEADLSRLNDPLKDLD